MDIIFVVAACTAVIKVGKVASFVVKIFVQCSTTNILSYENYSLYSML